MNSIDHRLTELESALEDQQARIEAHEETIAAQQATIEAQRERLAAVENDGGVSMPMSRRGALTAGGALGLLGLGAGTASATTGTGQIGTESNSVDTVFTNAVKNSANEDIEITSTVGDIKITAEGDFDSTIELGRDLGEFLNFSFGNYTPMTLGGPSVKFNTGTYNTSSVDLNGANLQDTPDIPIWDSNKKEIPGNSLGIWDSGKEAIPVDNLDIDGIAGELTVDDDGDVVEIDTS